MGMKVFTIEIPTPGSKVKGKKEAWECSKSALGRAVYVRSEYAQVEGKEGKRSKAE